MFQTLGQPAIRQVMIGGAGGAPRASLFGATVSQGSGFDAQALGRAYGMGQTPVQWYDRAKVAIAEFDSLITRLEGIANKTERENILDWIGSPTDNVSDPPAYRYATVVYNMQHDVERFTPPNYGAYDESRLTNRIEKLEEYNAELSAKIKNAEAVYGILPPVEREVIERTRFIEGPTDYTLPLLAAGAAALGVGLIVLLTGK